MVQQQELVAYFTNCKLQKIHTRLALMSALTVCYRGGSFTTAANFVRMLLENNPPVAQAEKARKVLVACNDKKDTKQLNYDFQESFCGFWGNFCSFLPWAEGCLMSLLFGEVWSSH